MKDSVRLNAGDRSRIIAHATEAIRDKYVTPKLTSKDLYLKSMLLDAVPKLNEIKRLALELGYFKLLDREMNYVFLAEGLEISDFENDLPFLLTAPSFWEPYKDMGSFHMKHIKKVELLYKDMLTTNEDNSIKEERLASDKILSLKVLVNGCNTTRQLLDSWPEANLYFSANLLRKFQNA